MNRRSTLPLCILSAFLIAPSLVFAQNYYPGGFSNTNLKLWLDASVPNSIYSNQAGTSRTTGTGADTLVAFWKDLSGNGNNLTTPATDTTRPSWSLSEGIHAVRFKGNSKQVLYRSGSVDTGGVWSVGIAMIQDDPAPLGDRRAFHIGPWVAASGGNGTSLSLGTSFFWNRNSAHTATDHNSSTGGNAEGWLSGLVLRYASDSPAATASAQPKTVLYATTTAADPSSANMVPLLNTLKVGVISSGSQELSTSNPLVTWDGLAVTAAGRTSISPATAPIGSGYTSVGAAWGGSPTLIANDPFTGRISEITVFDRKLNAAEQVILSNCFNAHLAPSTVSLGSADYYTQDAVFRNHMVGVGKASPSDTVARTQTSSRGLGFGVNDVGAMSDGSYVMMAHNGADSLVSMTSHAVDGTGTVFRLARVWKLQKTGFTSGPASMNMYFDVKDFFGPAVTNGAAPYAPENTTYYLLKSTDSSMSSPSIVASSSTGGSMAYSLDFSVPLSSLESAYYTIGCLSDTAMFPVVYTGTVDLPDETKGTVELGTGASTTITSKTKTVKGTLSLSAGSTMTLDNSTLVVDGTLRNNGGTIALYNCSKIIIKTTRSYMKGTGGTISIPVTADTSCSGLEYQHDAYLYFTGNGGQGNVGYEWPWKSGPSRVRMTGNNVVTMTASRDIHMEARFQNGILELNGHTLRMKGFSSRDNGRIRGGYNGTMSTITIDSVSQKFELPEILHGLKALQVVNTLTWPSADPTVELNGSLVLHDDLLLAHGTLSIAGTQNAPNVLTLRGTISNGTGSIKGGQYSSLEISDSTGNLPQVTLPPITNGLKDLLIDRRNGVKLGSDLTVTSSATLNVGMNGAGTLDVDTRTLTLGSAASLINETADNPITGHVDTLTACGRITTTRSLSSSVNGETFGNIGVAITTSTPMGTTTVTRNYSQWFAGPAVVNGEYRKSIKRTYTISPTSNSSLDATLVFRYHDGALDGQSESSLKLIRKDPATGAWQVQSSTVADPNANTLTLTGIPAFSEWSAEDGISVLPVELVSFSGIERNGRVQLSWKTATETNNYGFEVERRSGASGGEASMHAQSLFAASTWQNIGFVAGGGTTSSERRYGFTDDLHDGAGAMPVLSYRLRQIDRDGTVDYSPVVVVTRGSALPASVLLDAPHPNPATNGTAATLTLPLEALVSARLYTMEGRVAATLIETQVMGAGVHTIVIPRPAHALGTYLLVVQTDDRRLVRPVTFVQ